MKLKPLQLARRISLGFFLALVTTLAFLHQTVPGAPSIDGLCPFGGFETLQAWLAGGEFLKNVFAGNILLMVAVVVLGIVAGRFFCGWICAFGALQGIFGWLGRKLFKRRFDLPPKLDGVLRYFKYVVLAFILVMTWQLGTLFIRPYDPWAAYGHLAAGPEELIAEFGIGLAILVASLVLSLFSDRVFCKYVCPLGAVNAILAKVPLLRIKREASTCTSCSLCNRACPMKVEVAKADTVKPAECIQCFECVDACPTKKGTLKAVWAGRAVKAGWIALAGLVVYLGAVGIGSLVGYGKFGPDSLASKAKAGPVAITDIKGSSTWGEVAAAFGVDLTTLAAAAGVDPAKIAPETMLKETAAKAGAPDFTPDTLRVALAKLLGIEYAGEEGESGEEAEGAAPAPGAPAPSTEPAASTVPAPKASAAATAPAASAPVPAASAAPAAPKAAPANGLTVPADFELEGTMTLADVAAALGGTVAQVAAKLGLPADAAPNVPLKTLKDSYGVKMPDLKARIHQ